MQVHFGQLEQARNNGVLQGIIDDLFIARKTMIEQLELDTSHTGRELIQKRLQQVWELKKTNITANFDSKLAEVQNNIPQPIFAKCNMLLDLQNSNPTGVSPYAPPVQTYH